MKSIVVYYSATGNTAKVARAIHNGVKEFLGECEISRIRDMDPKNMDQYDFIVIGGPIWWYRETANLRLFIYNMPRMEGKLCVPFCVHGAAPAGFFFSMTPALQKKGLTIIGYNDWYGSVSQVTHMFKPYLTDGHPDEIDLKEAADFGREMAERASKIAAGQTNLIPKLPKGPKVEPLWRPPGPPQRYTYYTKSGEGMEMPPMQTPQRIINMAKCLYPECTICADNCSMNNIDLSANLPRFKGSCVNGPFCRLCERICPAGAVETDEAAIQQMMPKVINMEKCAYPECTLCVDHCPMNAIDFSKDPPSFKSTCEMDDLCWVICPRGAIEMIGIENMPYNVGKMRENHPFYKFLDEEAVKGRFRWLVRKDEIGWDNPIFKMQHSPRFVIEED